MVAKIVPFLLGGGTTAAVIKLVRLLVIHRRKREIEQHQKAMAPFELARVIENKNSVYKCLNTIVSKTNAVRAGIGRLENGGKLAKVGSPLYVTAVSECFGEKLSEVSSAWEKQRVDTVHQSLLQNLLSQKDMYVFQRNLGDSILKTFYASHNIRLVRYLEIIQPLGLYFYLALQFNDEVLPTPEEELIIQIYFNKIRNIYENDYKEISGYFPAKS